MKRYFIITTILFAFMFASCDEFLDVNVDPNNPTEVTPDLILPVAQTYTADINWASPYGNQRGSNHLGNMMMFNWGETFGFSWYDTEFKYLVTSTFYANLFDHAYYNALKQYSALDDLDSKYGNYKAISKIMKSYHFELLVDMYGDVPYSEALKRGSNPTPKYDKAEDIYKDLMVQLTSAVAMIDSMAGADVSVVPGSDDVMFGGDMTMWKQFANTLKVRMLNRAKGSFDANAELSTIAAEGSGFITADVAVQPGYLVEEGKQNPFWNDLGWNVGGNVKLTNDATCATQYILGYLTNTNDTRIDFIYEKPEDGHLGVDQGEEATEDQNADHVSNIGPGILKSATMGTVIFTLAESDFNQAELALDGFGSGDAEALYYAGIEASFAYLGAGSSSSYASQGVENISYAASTDKREAIITQKWIALNGVDAIQSWFDYSRTGYPRNLPVSADASTPDRPVRLFYPSSEVTGNTINLPSQPNAFTDKIFWAN